MMVSDRLSVTRHGFELKTENRKLIFGVHPVRRSIAFVVGVLVVATLRAAPEDEIAKKLSKDAQQDLTIFKAPTTSLDAWKIVDFEISVGKYEIAAEFLKLFFDLNPTEKDYLALEKQYTIQPFLNLRNIQRWSRNEAIEKEARQNTEKLIGGINDALAKELGNPERIRKYVNRLTGEPEEIAWAIKELKRSGALAVPEIVNILQSNPPAELKGAIFEYLPKLDPNTVPPLIAYLDVPDPDTRRNVLEVLRKRGDFVALAGRVTSDVTGSLWNLFTPNPQNDSPRPEAASMLREITLGDPAKKSPARELISLAEKFYQHQGAFGSGDDVQLWKWDGKGIISQTVPISVAEEYYGLRYARWALDAEPTSLAAQNVFLSLALEKHFLRAGLEQPLAKSSPTLYASLSTAPPELLSDLLERALGDQKPAIAYAVLQVIGDRGEKGLAANGPAKPNGDARYGILIKALNSSDKRIQFAAAEAILRFPGEAKGPHGARIIDILREGLREEKSSAQLPSKPKALLAKSERTKAEDASQLMRAVGFDVDVVLTGKDLFRKLNLSSEYDLILLDGKIPLPPLPELLAQILSDARVGSIPVLLIAIPDREKERDLLARITAISESKFASTGSLEAASFQLKNLQDQLRVLREREIESLSRLARQFKGVRVIPELFTEAGWQRELTVALVEPLNPIRSDVEKKATAKAAAAWLRKIAIGEVKGYQIDPATETAVRKALESDDLAPYAIDAVARFHTKEAQSDLANLLLAASRPASLRLQAGESLVKHLQQHGKNGLSAPQVTALIDGASTEANPELKQKFLVLKGILEGNPKATGDLLKRYQPESPAPAPKVEPKKEEEKKE
jgi:hypothetical protein